MIFLTEEDFSLGEYKIPMNKDLCNEDLVSYIEKYEIEITYDLFGCEMGKEFINDYNTTAGIMNSTAFQNLWNPICEDLGCYIMKTDGYLDILKGFIFFYYMRDFQYKRTMTGVISLQNENSVNLNTNQWGLFNYYNNTIKKYKSLQNYIKIYKNEYIEYTNFKGIDKKFMSLY